MDSQAIAKFGKQLRSKVPVLGHKRQVAACRKLAEDGSAQAVPYLVEALRSVDPEVRGTAEAALRALQKPAAVDALCEAWAARRDEELGRILTESGYVASHPMKLRILTGLKTGRKPELDLEAANVVPYLLDLTQDTDPEVRRRALEVLRATDRPAAVDALCELAIRDPWGLAAKVCVETGKRPSDPERACLFLFVTRKLDAYFQEDPDFQKLRRQYATADTTLREHVMEVVRAGDPRCLGLFGARKSLPECSDEEIRLAIESAVRRKEWPRLFRVFLELPMRYGFPLLEHFSDSGWEPENPQLKSLYRRVLEESAGTSVPLPAEAGATSSVFERWLEAGRRGELSEASEADLLGQLKTATPGDGVQVVAALATKCGPDSAAAREVRESPHWLIRLAGYASGLCCPDLTQDQVEDSNYWVRTSVGGCAALTLWPGKATAADLEALNAAPREAFTGRFGAVRRVLQVLIEFRLTAGKLEPIGFEAGDFSGKCNADR